jgi:Leucine-rich repeat (LRR) protein
VGGGIYLSKNNGDTERNTDGSDTSKKVVNLSNKGLTKAPEYIFDQSNIVELDLSDNSIDGALQSQIQKLQNLKVLNLSNNKFTGVPAEVGQLKKLEILDLSNNQLTGLPNELGNLSNLKLLDLTGNNYSEADLTTIRKNLPSQTVIKTN